jgi:hypothetical protein
MHLCVVFVGNIVLSQLDVRDAKRSRRMKKNQSWKIEDRLICRPASRHCSLGVSLYILYLAFARKKKKKSHSVAMLLDFFFSRFAVSRQRRDAAPIASRRCPEFLPYLRNAIRSLEGTSLGRFGAV